MNSNLHHMGDSMANWGQQFGNRMNNFGQSMSQWGSAMGNWGHQMSGQMPGMGIFSDPNFPFVHTPRPTTPVYEPPQVRTYNNLYNPAGSI